MEASRDHDDEEHPAPILAAEPTDPPAINTIPDRYRLSQPQELSLNLHVPRPDTSMALPAGAFNRSNDLDQHVERIGGRNAGRR
jgi:hypothetical protein